ncbi:MAG: DNA replication and repair protein RecF, partial [Hyphomicrobiales bacterium]|nr:DNA replication and repair protein RecF [Hyphomicrobiales bacterium]
MTLADFRSYPALDLAGLGRIVALTGANGAGKTNLVEAISLFAQGRGLRRAEPDALARAGGGGGFSVALEIGAETAWHSLGLGWTPGAAEEPGRRRHRVDGSTVASGSAFAEHLRVVWLTPAMDGLFSGPPGDRRRFLDRATLAVDPGHGARVSRLERQLRARNRLLEDRAEARWLDAAERELAEVAVA